jgi:PPM family protein phosphatase
MTENNFQMYSAAVSDRGLSEKRPQNEDSFLEMPKLGLFAVADGVGGAQAGDVASQMAVEILGEAFVNLQANGDAEQMMQIAIERANSAIYQMSSDLPQLSTMATTVVALQLSGNIATIGHVGDSRLYRLDAKGSLYRETQDHSVVEEEVRAGRMTAAQAANHPSRNVISRALGAESTVEVDMKTIMIEPNTSFLICSDGITRHINDFEIRELLIGNVNPTETCQKMKDICYSRGAEDNLTAVIIKVVGAAVEDEYPKTASSLVDLDEEATVATARQATADNSFADVQDEYEEIPTRGLEMPVSMQTPPETNELRHYPESPVYSKDDDEAYLMDEPSGEIPPTAPVTEEIPKTLSFPANEPIETAPAIVEPATVAPKKDYAVYEEEEKSSGFFGNLLSSLLLLLVGAILGVAGYYVWLMMNAKPTEVPPKITEMQTSNIPFSSFEQLRRKVDADPNSIVSQYEKTTPRDAAEFYLLGRARLLNKNYEDAKKAFIEARNKLSEYSESSNKAVLTSDITIGLAIAEDKAAQTAFEKELKFLGGGEANSQPNAQNNSNTGVSSNSVVGNQ